MEKQVGQISLQEEEQGFCCSWSILILNYSSEKMGTIAADAGTGFGVQDSVCKPGEKSWCSAGLYQGLF